ncbi:DNA mismatch repair endonuclease MutL [Romboutsia weinsteinii]|uniref:DNA mismatch repair protein MutL n=1 Tax=Romboutsia weinsteinii TaxID=2020949 RepID=A0A371J6D0_9FIRM|nr:DNA mismatch repair endonuclease MutL [Romboutsia weinsteinii]RDY28253.1 DNA mismatch repair endonuclease MutL [Romboutsia weinsteinii]
MENRINILDDLTINKIAAGEVVERPSSVVKELIENCVDAKSTKIIVDIVDGGKKSIRITDNGIGIPSSEVSKSFLRHATSKIKEIDDLYDLYSLGFRGEALASISAVSKLEMITKTKDEAVGTRVYVEGGKVITKEPIGATNGTTIIIKDIFYNTPVRQKFLKSTHAETINISDLINKLAIGNPNIQIKYINNGKPMLNTPGDNKLLSVIRSIYGKDITGNLIEVEYECSNFKLSGYIGNNNVYRSNKNLQHIYINKRFVKSKLILDAINESYKSIIPGGKHAVCFLDLEIKPSTIDVNIHPTKLEVKFENEQEIYVELRDYLKRKLLGSTLIGKYETYNSPQQKIISRVSAPKEIPVHDINNTDEKPIESFKSVSDILNKEEADNSFRNINSALNIHEDKEKVASNEIDLPLENITLIKELSNKKDEYIIEGNLDISKSFSIEELEKLDKIKPQELQQNTDTVKEENSLYEFKSQGKQILSDEANANLNQTYNMYDTSIKTSEEKNIIDPQESKQEMFFEENEDKFSLKNYKIIGSVFSTYIVLEKGNSMYLLDQHVAHERILYEKYMEKFYNHDISMQMLLDPIILELSNVDMLQVENNLDLFTNFGFEIELFGNNHIMIRCVPTTFGIPESEKFILQIIDNINEIKNNYELKGEKFASMACRAAIKANDKIHTIEIESLLDQMQYCKNPFTCPHGRPIIVEISKKEIEKMFKRIM